MGRITDLFEKHKLIRRLLVIWAIVMITIVIFWVFDDVTKITAPVASSLGLVIGILATVIGFYQWSRNKDAGN